MKAVVWHGKQHVSVDTVDDPKILNPRDAIVEVTATAICGSDCHLYNGFIPGMEDGDILGHEFMGRIVEVGSAVTNLRLGDRVIVPFTIACGSCDPCSRGFVSGCANSNPNAGLAEKLYGYSGAGLFGYSHIYGGYSGGQAEYVRVPFADFGPFKVPDELTDEQVLFLTDIFPTGYAAAERCHITPSDVVAVWGCGPVGQFAIRSAFLLGAQRVIAIDRFEERLALARRAGAETMNHDEVDNILDALYEFTGGRGVDCAIDCVGLEAHGTSADAVIDYVKQAVKVEQDRSHVLREAIQAAGIGARLSVPGVYGGFLDTFPMGAFFAKGMKMGAGQTNVQPMLPALLEHIVSGQIDLSEIITNRISLEDAPAFYDKFANHKDGVIKVIMKPRGLTA
jgi:threonine dehydrogenase-like Zn-dependent dehydrogenase